MRIQVISNASDAHQAQFIGKTAIVIDVIRTSTTIIAALDAGAACIIPAETVMEAKAIAKEGDLLGGERFCKRISGFDLGNSPLEYSEATVKHKRIILTTTHGTRAIQRSRKASKLFIAGLTNATACIQAALHTKRDLVIVCAGSHDQFTIEDGFCAGLMIARLKEMLLGVEFTMNDFGYAMLSLYEHMKQQLPEIMKVGLSGKRLQAIQMYDDISECAKIDQSTIVPHYVNGALVPFASMQ